VYNFIHNKTRASRSPFSKAPILPPSLSRGYRFSLPLPFAVCKQRWRHPRTKLTNIQVPRSKLLCSKRDAITRRINSEVRLAEKLVASQTHCRVTLRAPYVALPGSPCPPPPPCSPSFFIRKQLINPNPVRGSADNECNKNTRANNNSELERNMLRGLPSPRNAPPFSPPSTLHPRPRYHCLSSAGWGDLRGRATKRRDCLHNIIRRRSRPRDLEHHRA
jgi:hypothetical protein